ncbi:MAG: hypothetical protein P4L53_18485 [Candidatus Obscuribacterales bacterium]|nr:hypothetical protein [Candidatus Obscuribacterales bacterium]
MAILEVSLGSNLLMPLPQGWREFPVPSQGAALYIVREFRPADSLDDTVSLCFFNRGLALADYEAQAFQKVLVQPEHQLSQTEIQELSEIFGDAGNAETFSITDARSQTIAGRMALIVEGRFYSSKTAMFRIYMSAGADGRFVDEIFFSAPPKDYEKNIEAVKASVFSLKNK